MIEWIIIGILVAWTAFNSKGIFDLYMWKPRIDKITTRCEKRHQMRDARAEANDDRD